jgi:hypothetical protein
MTLFCQRFLLAAAALCLFSTGLLAQQSSAPANNAGSAGAQSQSDPQGDRTQIREQNRRRMAMLSQLLNLTDDQKRQWVQIQKDTTQKVQATRRDDSLNEEQMQQKLREIHREQKQQTLAMLTPQQQEALKNWWEEQKQKQQDKGADANADSSASTQAKATDKGDDFFAGMVQDPDPASNKSPAPGPKKPAPPKN